MSGWLTVIGLGEEGPDALAPAARALIDRAEVLVGGERHLAMIPDGTARRLTWRRPLLETMNDIRAVSGRRVVVLATGDPFCFGIGTTLRRAFPDEEIVTIPAPSAFSLARARLGWSADETLGVSLHGRPLETVRAYLAPGQRLLVLSHDGATPAQVAAQLTAVGYGASTLTVFAHMGGPDEARVTERADRWREAQIPDLNTIAVECRAEGKLKRFRGAPGLPDRAFENDGQLTKREIRVQTISALDPRPGALLWDVGAGSGSVAIEWLLSERTCNAIAVERDAERCARIARNAAALGVPRLTVREGAAPEALEPLPAPDAVFIGGGLAVGGLIETCWARLAPGGTLVANVVTVAGEAVLGDWCAAPPGLHDPPRDLPRATRGAPPRLAPAHAGDAAHAGQARMSGLLSGIGVGPGDPDLITLKALKALQGAQVVAYPAPPEGESLARSIAAAHLPGGQEEIAIRMPLEPSRFPAAEVYDEAASTLGARLHAGRDVAVLCEGDPFVYGSFLYLFERLAQNHRVEVIPGVSSPMACAAALGLPLAARNDVLAVIPAPLDDQRLAAQLANCDAAAIVKVGRHLEKVRRVLGGLGLLARAHYVERASMATQRIMPLAEVEPPAPYFSMIIVHKRGAAWR